MGFILRLLVNALALYLLTQVYSGVFFEGNAGVGSVLIAALVMGIVNALIRPVLLLLSLPLTLLTLGLFTLVVNGVVLSLVAAITALDVAGFGAAIVGALILTIISWLLDSVVGVLGLDGGKRG
ncbi:phage holin family protein [Deinococcus arenicola]|uniref:Phage holin family protein n=1 Tax=Deinococcus arenicola TaxID=2994950 RepID=A0ABU4DNF9_9DEIO|nr:phage holin family protein [Deinococcus sp. ZS9-10]MDV6373888.1 phage holin family protein [Deinococcus sp. ZS9-10]